jgi:hypothetical protein
MEKYRIIRSRNVEGISAEINKHAEQGYKPAMMSTAVFPPGENDPKGILLGGNLEIIILLQRE